MGDKSFPTEGIHATTELDHFALGFTSFNPITKLDAVVGAVSTLEATENLNFLSA